MGTTDRSIGKGLSQNMARNKDLNWNLKDSIGNNATYDDAQLAILMDLRDELKHLNSILDCPNFQAIPELLRSIKVNVIKANAKRRQPKKI